MARKPASMYRRLKGPAYTRRKYIGGVPNNRIHQFHVGNRRAAETGQFSVVVELVANNDCQIRHTALEAARVISNSTIRKQAGAQGYALRVHTYPHHVLRENKQATGAGAERSNRDRGSVALAITPAATDGCVRGGVWRCKRPPANAHTRK